MAKADPFPPEHFGARSADDGILMSTSPEAWYLVVHGVPSMISFDRHLPREIGPTFVVVEAGFVFGAVRVGSRALLWTMGAICVRGHTLFNVRDVAVGICESEVPHGDFLAVAFPALSGVSLNVRSFRHADHR